MQEVKGIFYEDLAPEIKDSLNALSVSSEWQQ